MGVISTPMQNPLSNYCGQEAQVDLIAVIGLNGIQISATKDARDVNSSEWWLVYPWQEINQSLDFHQTRCMTLTRTSFISLCLFNNNSYPSSLLHSFYLSLSLFVPLNLIQNLLNSNPGLPLCLWRTLSSVWTRPSSGTPSWRASWTRRNPSWCRCRD